MSKLNGLNSECPICLNINSLDEHNLFNEKDKELIEYYQQELEKLEKKKIQLDNQLNNTYNNHFTKSKAINGGFIAEKIITTLSTFPWCSYDCTPMFDPVDYIIFNGLHETGVIEDIIFIDIKTGNAKLNQRQEQIKLAVENGNIKFKTI